MTRYAFLLATLLLTTPAAAIQPQGIVQFCADNPTQCVVQGRDHLAGTAALLTDLLIVNITVNAAIQYRSEDVGLDVWRVDVQYGDCEDYALTKRAQLIALGYDASALRLAVVLTAKAEVHAVLVVVTDTDELVLDNLNPAVVRFKDAGYILLGMSSADPLIW